ncbi:MAG: bifunctional UDP-sugar hydrolase/5'-nucleotidase [Candidatus Eremiobacterota bacterium]
MIQSAHINTDPGNNYLIAGQLKTPNKPLQMKELSGRNLTEVLNINLEEAHNLYNKDRTKFSEIKQEENVPPGKEGGTSSDMPHSASSGTSPQTEATVNIIYTNDLHGSFLPKENEGSSTGGMAYTASVIRELKNKSEGNSLLLDGGDWSQGSYESGLTKGKTMIKVMNNLGYDAAETGNHEYDWSKEDLKEMAREANFPVLGANLEKEKAGVLDEVKPYTVKEIDGVKIGIIGLITPEVAKLTKPQNMEGLKVLDPKETAAKYVKELREKGIDTIVVLSHQGEEADKELAGSVEGIDVIVGGHSHTAIDKPDVVNGTLIVQSGSKGEFVGNLELSIDRESKKIVSSKNELIPVNTKDIKPDSDVEKIIAPVLEEAKKKQSELLGTTETDLNHSSRVTESAMGHIITDGMREKTRSDIAIINSGGIRGEIRKGDITYGGLYKILPFENKLVTMNLTGRQIKEVLEHTPWTEKNDLQVSGMTLDIDKSKPEGERIVSIKTGDKPLEMDKIYRVTADDFLANGGAGYDTLKKGTNTEYGDLVVDTVSEYIKSHEPFNEDINKEKRINYR